MKHTLLLLTVSFFFGLYSYGQGNVSIKHIDHLLNVVTIGLAEQGKLDEALLISLNTIQKSKEINYNKGLATGFYRTANLLSSLGEYEESFKYLELIKDVPFEKDVYLQAQIYGEYGRNYDFLNLYDRSIYFYDKALNLLKGEPQESCLKAILLHGKASPVSSRGNVEYAMKLQKKALLNYPLISCHAGIETYFRTKGIIDSANYYLDKGFKQLNKNRPYSKQKASLLYEQGELYHFCGNYPLGIKFYKEALDIAKKYKDLRLISKMNKKLAAIYNDLGDIQKSYEYQVAYIEVNSLYKKRRQQAVDYLFQLSLKQTYEKNKNKRFWLRFYVLGVLLIIFIILLVWKIWFKSNTPSSKNRKVKAAERENKIETLLSLAKKNDPSFVIQFQNFYPDLNKKLLSVNPKLTKKDLRLCGMIWLNFNSEDIAKYTDVQIRTVQVQKYRLRKKLDLNNRQNLYNWIKKMD